MKGYSPTLGTRLRWLFIAATVVFIGLMIYAAVTNAGKNRREQCWTANKTTKFESFLGTDLGKARLAIKWCGNGNRITDIKNVDLDAWTTSAGSISGWNVKDKDKSGNWFRWDGNDHGGRYVQGVVHFHRDPLGGVAFPDDEYLKVAMKVYANGKNTGDFGSGGAWRTR